MSGSLTEALEAYWDKPVVKQNHGIVSGKWQHVDTHIKWQNDSTIGQRYKEGKSQLLYLRYFKGCLVHWTSEVSNNLLYS